MSLYQERADELLRIHGLRRTPGRTSLLATLAMAKGPVSMEYLQNKLSKDLDLASLYRAIDAFIDEGMIIRFEFGSGRAFYELAHDKPHHHHVVCEKCGIVEDVPAQDSPQLTRMALRHARRFSSISRHSLEFYGRCVECT